MRPTDLKFRSPKESTPGPYYPLITHEGRSLQSGKVSKRISFGTGPRFNSYKLEALKLGYRVGPSSYTIQNEAKSIRSHLYKPLHGSTKSNDYHFVGYQMILYPYQHLKKVRKLSFAGDVHSSMVRTKDSCVEEYRPMSAASNHARSSKNRPLNLL